MTAPEIRIVERVEPDKTKHFILTQGSIEMEMFPDNLLKSIDQVDKLPAGKWTEFAAQNDLPCDPLDRKLLKPPLMGIVQLAWHAQFKGSVSEKLALNQERRVETYKQDLEHLKLVASSPAEKTARSRKPASERSPQAPTMSAPASRFRLKDATAVTWSQFRTQKGLIVAVMIHANATEAGGKSVTKDQVVAAIRGKLNTRQPEERVVGYYLSEWQKGEIVEKVEDPMIALGEVASDFEAKEPVAVQATPEPAPAPAAAEKPAGKTPKKATKKK